MSIINDIDVRIKKIKIYILDYRYKYLSELLFNIEKHLDNLVLNNILNSKIKTKLSHKLFDLLRHLTVLYNDYITNDANDRINFILSQFDGLIKYEDDNNVFEKIYPLIKENKEIRNILPLYDVEEEIIEIIKEYGYNNILDLIDILNNSIKIELNESQNILIKEINKIFIPLKISIINNKLENNYIWKMPTNYSDDDVLELSRDLLLLNNNNTIKINGIFINDTLTCYLKSCQINYPIIYNIKKNILLNCTINNDFIKKFIRYDYLGNIYTMSLPSYIKLLENSYCRFLELSKSNFVNIMKEFGSKDITIKKMYEMIFLLLLGNNNNINMSGLLLNLTKDKKNNNLMIYNIIYNRLPYYLLLKIKKSNNSIKIELEKIKNNINTNIDYKKQIIINKNIPNYIKNITLEKIEEMSSNNNEYYKQLLFVKNILNYPWYSEDDDIFFKKFNKEGAKKYLINIEDKLKNLSYGHHEAKKELLQTIGKWISNPKSQGTCFGLVGPPGVGKTLLAKSIGKALNIPFAEITLGGQNDGEILFGHGYTYSGSQPGLIIKKMVEMGKSRCILYFDELDKTCSKNGPINEITSILIHLTDPNMNKTFQDRFFQGIDFPLDKVIMIFSYNDASLIDPILLDRLKQININPYTTTDKINIVKTFIINEIAESIGLQKEPWINISDELIEFIIDNYTNEAGVRSIKRKIEQIFLQLNLEKIFENNAFENGSLNEITKDIIIRILEKPKNNDLIIPDKSSIGIINGLYANSHGNGGIIPIQVFNNYSPNSNIYEIKLTGKQGDVMKESVHCSLTVALEYIKNNSIKYNIINLDTYLHTYFKSGFHVHTPSTSTPKDGPSAGCAFACAFISRILNRPIKNNIAITGEIELTGKITKIGGLNFKLIGAKKAGVNLVFIPKENEHDLDEIKIKHTDLIDDTFNVKSFQHIDEIIDLILI